MHYSLKNPQYNSVTTLLQLEIEMEAL